MITVDKQSRVPVYEQIKNQLLTFIRLGVIPINSQLPSIRSVSSDTGVNINTVKKAFAELEMAGVIYTVPGTGSFVSENALNNTAVTAKIRANLADDLESAKASGLAKEEIITMINNVYGGD